MVAVSSEPHPEGSTRSRASVRAHRVPEQKVVQVATVLDDVKASHREDTITEQAADTLRTLAESVIRSGATGATATSRWAAILGPVLMPGATARLLHISRAGLDKRRASGAVLGVQTESGRWVYPLGQFRLVDGRLEVAPAMRPLLGLLLGAADGLAAARWLGTPNRRLGGRTPWDAIRAEGEDDTVLDAARAQASAWAGA